MWNRSCSWGRERQINVWLDPEKLRSYGLTVTDAVRALQAENIQVPGGSIEQGERDLTPDHGPSAHRARLPRHRGGREGRLPDKVSDVGYVEDGAEEAETVANVGGKPAVISTSGSRAARIRSRWSKR